MKILFTGSRGFLGTALCAELRKKHQVTGIDLTHSWLPNELRADVAEWRELENLSRYDLVFHFAAEFGRRNGENYSERMWRSNVIGTNHIVRLCKRWKCPIVFASSSEAYGRLADKHEFLREDIAEAPEFHNEYALSKWTGEQQIRMADIPHIILRIFNVYGPGEFPTPYRSMVSRFCFAGNTGERVTVYDGIRTHLYIDDFLSAVSRIPESSLRQEIINAADDEPCSNLAVAIMAGADWISGGLEQNNVMCKRADNSKFVDFLGYKKTVSLQEGIQRTRRWLASSLSTTGASTCSPAPLTVLNAKDSTTTSWSSSLIEGCVSNASG